MFKTEDVVFIHGDEKKYYTIKGFYISIADKACVYLLPQDGEIPRNYNGFRFRGMCGVPTENISHVWPLAPDWEI